jgi:LPS export ABC transporter protein LptC
VTPWQRRLRLGLGLFIVVFATGLYLSLRRAPPRIQPAPVKKADPAAGAEWTKGQFLRALGVREDIRILFDQLVQYPDGRNKMVGVKFKLPQRGGRDYTVTAREGELVGDMPTGDVTLHGAVDLVASDGLTVRTEDAVYSGRDGVVRAPGPVSFSRDRMSGESVGMTYDKDRDVVALLANVRIRIAPDEKGEDSAEIEAGSATMPRRDKYLSFDGGVKIVRQGQTTTADRVVAYLSGDERRIQLVELRGASRVVGSKPAPGGLKSMSSRDMNLVYGADGRTLDRAQLVGTAAIDLAGAADAQGRRVAGESIDLALAPDGATLTSLAARQDVQLDIPADPSTPARTIRSGTLQSVGKPGVGLTSATFSENVEFRETPTPPAGVRVARSGTLELALKGGFTTIDSAQFGGGVRFEDQTMTATGREARYAIAAGVLTLTGADEKTGRPPQVVDDRATIEGRRIEIALDAERVTAAENVKSVFRASAQRGAGGKDETRLPAILKQDQPVFASADGLVYESSTSLATYTGRAQLWQGDTTVKGDRLVVDDRKGDLSASGNVVSKMPLQQVDEKTGKKEAYHSLATSRDMVYEDRLRRATYTGGAHLNSPEGDLTADKIEIYLKESGDEVERLEGYTAVNLRSPEGRKANGSRLTYFASDERYEMLGLPVKIEDESGEMTGKSLTFWRSTDRIVIDGKEEKRTEMKRGVKRQGLRFD